MPPADCRPDRHLGGGIARSTLIISLLSPHGQCPEEALLSSHFRHQERGHVHPINPFIRGYHNLTVQRQLAVHVAGDCPLILRPLHPPQASLSDEQLLQSACCFNDKHAVIISGLLLDSRRIRARHHEGCVVGVIHAVIAIEAEGPVQ